MENDHSFFENRSCRYYPCHKDVDSINCLFCYCPLYGMPDCPGKPEFVSRGDGYRKVCTGCTFPHERDNYDRIIKILKSRGLFTEEQIREGRHE